MTSPQINIRPPVILEPPAVCNDGPADALQRLAQRGGVAHVAP